MWSAKSDQKCYHTNLVATTTVAAFTSPAQARIGLCADTNSVAHLDMLNLRAYPYSRANNLMSYNARIHCWALDMSASAGRQ